MTKTCYLFPTVKKNNATPPRSTFSAKVSVIPSKLLTAMYIDGNNNNNPEMTVRFGLLKKPPIKSNTPKTTYTAEM